MASGRVDRRVIAAGVGIPLVIAVAVVANVLVGGDGSSDVAESLTTTTTASDPPASTALVAVDEAWNEELAAALEPLQEAIPELSEGVTSWSSGDLDDAALTEVLDRVAPVVDDVRDDVEALPPHPEDELAVPLVGGMARLYDLAVDAHRHAVRVDDAEVATQYDRLGRRLRILGDRVFDRARERTAARFDAGESVDLHLPAEVPDWTRLDMAVGPPLEPTDTNVDELPLEREDERASQAEADWLDRLDELDVPTVAEVEQAFSDPEALGSLARELVAAAETLRSVPVPDHDRARADRVALGWLIRADAARAGQLAGTAGAPGATSQETAADGAITDLAPAILEVSALEAFDRD